jgi:hypothetical protein
MPQMAPERSPKGGFRIADSAGFKFQKPPISTASSGEGRQFGTSPAGRQTPRRDAASDQIGPRAVNMLPCPLPVTEQKQTRDLGQMRPRHPVDARLPSRSGCPEPRDHVRCEPVSFMTQTLHISGIPQIVKRGSTCLASQRGRQIEIHPIIRDLRRDATPLITFDMLPGLSRTRMRMPSTRNSTSNLAPSAIRATLRRYRQSNLLPRPHRDAVMRPDSSRGSAS